MSKHLLPLALQSRIGTLLAEQDIKLKEMSNRRHELTDLQRSVLSLEYNRFVTEYKAIYGLTVGVHRPMNIEEAIVEKCAVCDRHFEHNQLIDYVPIIKSHFHLHCGNQILPRSKRIAQPTVLAQDLQEVGV